MPVKTSSPERRPLVSLNVDVANLPRESLDRLVELAVGEGRVVISHAFGDFRREDMDELAVQLYQHGFRLIHCPAWPNQRGRLKSVVDDVMAQDLRDQLEYAPEIEVFIIGSGDRNFIAVANALKRHRKRVLVAADQESINRELRMCADGYLPLPRGRSSRPRPQPQPQPEPQPELDLPSDAELLEQVRRLAETNDYLTVRRIVSALMPNGVGGSERARSSLTTRLQDLIDTGDLRAERRVIRGRAINTVIVANGEAASAPENGSQPAQVAEVPEPAPPPRRRSRRRTSAPTTS